MISLNRVELIGVCGKDAELKELQSTKVTIVSVAITESYKNSIGEWVETTDWVTVKSFGKLAENMSKIKKGERVFISAKIKPNKYENQAGVTVYSTDIIADNFVNFGKFSKAENNTENANTEPPQNTNVEPDNSNIYDDDIPF